MLTLEIRVNGQLIGYTYIHNQKKKNKKGQTLYRFQHYQLGRKKLLDLDMWHNRDEGAEKLASLVYKKVNKELKKLDEQ